MDVIRNLAVKHGLTKAEVIAVVERVLAEMLAVFYGHDVIVDLDPAAGIIATAYRKAMDGTIEQIIVQPAILQRFGRGRVPRALEHELARLRVIKDVQHVKRHKNRLCWGEIIGREPDGTLLVEAEIDENPIIAECPPDLIGGHERESLQPGQRRAFHLRRVESVMLNGTPRLRLVLDRISRNLPAELLREYVPANNIRCQVRYVGGKSFITSRSQLPKQARTAVARELGEHILINQKPPGKWRKKRRTTLNVVKRS